MGNEVFNRAVKLLIKQEVKANISVGKIKSIDANTCEVERDGLPNLLDVRLNAIQGDLSSSITIYPKIGSLVLCAVIEGNQAETYIIATSEIDSIEVWFDNNKTKGYKISADGFVFDEGSNGGMTITPELKTQLDKTNQLIQALLNVISGSPIPEPGNGANSALQTAMALAITGLDLGDFSNIENERIKH